MQVRGQQGSDGTNGNGKMDAYCRCAKDKDKRGGYKDDIGALAV